MSDEQPKFKVGVWVKTLVDNEDIRSTRKAGEIGIIGEIEDGRSEDKAYSVIFNTADETDDYYWWYYASELELIPRPSIAINFENK